MRGSITDFCSAPTMPQAAPLSGRFRISLRELLVTVSLVALAIPSLQHASSTWLAIVAGVTMVAFFVALIGAVVDRGPRQAFAIGFALTMLAYGLILTNGREIVSGVNGSMSRNVEFDYRQARLPTSQLMRYVHAAVQRGQWFVLLPDLHAGSSSDLAEVLQRMLNARMRPSPNLTADGDFGLNTQQAVRQFQAQAGLPVTGIVDGKTWNALGPLIDPNTGEVLPAYAPQVSRYGNSPYSLKSLRSFRESPSRDTFMMVGHCWWALLLGYAGGHFARFVYWRRIREQQTLPADIP